MYQPASTRKITAGSTKNTHSGGVALTNQPAFNSAAFGGAGEPGGNIPISLENPFLSPQARAIITPQAVPIPELGGAPGFYLARANSDISTRRAEGEVDIYRFEPRDVKDEEEEEAEEERYED